MTHSPECLVVIAIHPRGTSDSMCPNKTSLSPRSPKKRLFLPQALCKLNRLKAGISSPAYLSVSSQPLKGRTGKIIDFGINPTWVLIPTRPLTSSEAFDSLEGCRPNRVQRKVNTMSKDLETVPQRRSEGASLYPWKTALSL